MLVLDAPTVIGIGVSLFGFGVAVSLGVDGWLKLKRFERESAPPPVAPGPDPAMAARLARIEQIVELTALEVERVAEAQRFVARTMAEERRALGAARSPERAITPH